MPKLTILTGPAGSGKSTLAKQLIEDYQNLAEFNNYYLSTDLYWLRPDQSYSFNARELEQAHNWTYKGFKEIIEEEDEESKIYGTADNIVLDNTNLTWWEIERYAKLALEHGWKVEIVEPQTEWKNDKDTLFRLNTHNVPLNTIERQLARKEPIEELRRKLDALRMEIEKAG